MIKILDLFLWKISLFVLRANINTLRELGLTVNPEHSLLRSSALIDAYTTVIFLKRMTNLELPSLTYSCKHLKAEKISKNVPVQIV